MTTDHHTSALLEDIRGQAQFLAEEHGVLVGRLDKVESRLGNVEGRLALVELDVGYLKRTFTDRFDAVDNRFDRLEADMKDVLDYVREERDRRRRRKKRVS